MKFNLNDVKRFVPLNEGDRIIYFLDRNKGNVKMLNVKSGEQKLMKDINIVRIGHGHLLIQFVTLQYKYKFEVYRGKLMDTKNQKVAIKAATIEPEVTVEEPALSQYGAFIDSDKDDTVVPQFHYDINLKQIDFTDHFYDRVKQRLDRADGIISDIAYESNMLFKNEAQGWIMRSLLTVKPEDLVVANKIVFVAGIRKKVWTASILIGKYTVVIDSYPERTKVVSFMDRSKTIINKTA